MTIKQKALKLQAQLKERRLFKQQQAYQGIPDNRVLDIIKTLDARHVALRNH